MKNATSTDRAKRAASFPRAAQLALTDDWMSFWAHIPDHLQDDIALLETLDYYTLKGGNGNPVEMDNNERCLLLCLVAARTARP